MRYSVYGYRFELTGTCEFARAGLGEDFRFFVARADDPWPAAGHVEISTEDGVPDYGGLPVSDAVIYTPRNVVYRDGSRRIIDYGGRALGTYDAAAGRFRVVGEDPHLVYEATYLFLLSQIGQALDRRGLHRLHALAMSRRGRSILVLLPMGGGKSTLGAALLKHTDLSILSDDSPLIDRGGNALAFPLRLGLLEGHAEDVPDEHKRLVRRMEFGPKYLVNYSSFGDRVVGRSAPGLLLLGRRTLARQGRIEPASYRSTMSGLVPNMIVGLGLFQGLEYVLERSSRELAGKTGLAWSRLRNAHALTRRSSRWLFHMGRDAEANARIVMELAERICR